jgi:hypothetical protein
MIDNQELGRSLRYLVHEWSDATLAVVCDELATELQQRGLAAYVGVELAASHLRNRAIRYPRKDGPASPPHRAAEEIKGQDCTPPTS